MKNSFKPRNVFWIALFLLPHLNYTQSPTPQEMQLIMHLISIMQGTAPWGTTNQPAALIEKFAPLVYFHPSEKYFPSSVDWFIARSSLKEKTSTGFTQIKPKGSLNLSNFIQYKNNPNYYLDPEGDKITYTGMPLIAKTIQNKSLSTSPAPVYVNVIPKPYGLILQYSFFYPYNGPFAYVTELTKDLSLGLTSADLDPHDGDWEHIDVHLTGSDPNWTLEKVYYARHHPREDGSYAYLGKDLAIEEGTHPVVYASLYGHASHPQNLDPLKQNLDMTGKGAIWRTWENNPVTVGNTAGIVPGQEWIAFAGRWGIVGGGITSPALQSWWFTVSPIGGGKYALQSWPITTVTSAPKPLPHETQRSSNNFTIRGTIPSWINALRAHTQPTTDPGSKSKISFDIKQDLSCKDPIVWPAVTNGSLTFYTVDVESLGPVSEFIDKLTAGAKNIGHTIAKAFAGCDKAGSSQKPKGVDWYIANAHGATQNFDVSLEGIVM